MCMRILLHKYLIPPWSVYLKEICCMNLPHGSNFDPLEDLFIVIHSNRLGLLRSRWSETGFKGAIVDCRWGCRSGRSN